MVQFPLHEDTKTLKMTVHGWEYTRRPCEEERDILRVNVSTPPLRLSRRQSNLAPADGIMRLREGSREILPEMADCSFDRIAVCWYTDTTTGDFTMDYHPDHNNLFIAGSGSGHAFKFLLVFGF